MAITEGQLISDGTVVWKVKKIGNGELPVGTMQMFAGNSIPAGWLLCDGSAVSRTNYDKLFSAIGTTWGEGDGSTTFNLPNSIGRFVEGAATAGIYKEAGLPNVTGVLNLHTLENTTSGCFYTTNTTTSVGWNTSSVSRQLALALDASRSNPIYGNSITVQPAALTMLPIIKY